MLLSYLSCADGWSLDDKVLAAWLLVHVRGCRAAEDSKLSCSLSVDCLWHKHVVAWRGALVTSQPVSLKARLWPSSAKAGEDTLCSLAGVVLKTISCPVICKQNSPSWKHEETAVLDYLPDVCWCQGLCVSGVCSYTIWNSLHSVTLYWGLYLMAGENG